ncbi:restriction endonuclease subunit S [Bosea sp. 47.2.35]|uniref:restriction endonuclease subunit S n=1 Tax=Bosea sp. 47.2.35 TaxID=2969304 RepID=UPI00214FADCD|nr:restriction endonuclease subunit S [Bosea sp. 47.2.35]MCR4523081.1 restriction endonuclease subunit S [Bosea sp. 47.2.35]
MSFPQVALGEFMLNRNSSTDPARFPDELFTLYSIPAFDAGRPERQYGRDIGSAKKNIEPGDILLSRLVPHIRRSWIVGHHDRSRIIGSGEWIIFRSLKINAAYLRHFLVSDLFHGQFMRTVAGVGGSLLRANPHQVAEITIPLPPLDEQRRIAAILDKADALRRKRKRTLDLLNGLTQSTFLEMFGDPVSNPKRLPATTLGELGVDMIYGPRFYNEEYSADGTSIVRITDLSEAGELDYQSMPKLKVSDEMLEEHRSRPGELLFARTGATVGKIALIRNEDPVSIPGAYFIRLKFPECIDPVFSWHCLRSRSIQEIIFERSRQSAQQNFSGPGLRRLPFILPTSQQQSAFVARVARIAMSKRPAWTQDMELSTLFSSLQHRAFTGQL